MPESGDSTNEIAGRYQLRGVLGRGGMGVVYRAYDARSQRELALKQLELPEESRSRVLIESLFEAEFRTLSQLTHPRAVEVYEYGLDARGPYYTMEILSGSSLAECAPLPWREACALMYDVCSCLAVLHSRRLLHRDVTPQNVRRMADGHAKLIDFGAMVNMGPNHPIVGTASFMAPEVAHRLTLDARADLFAVGATLYFALTGKLAYPARALADLTLAWRARPALPSTFQPDIPARLDALVLELLSLEPSLRPPTAADVMQKLRAAAGLERSEAIDASSVYLATPTLIGRDAWLAPIRGRARRAKRQRGSAWLFEGRPGSGRSRMLDAVAWQAQTEGLHVLRAGCRTIAKAPFALARALTEQLLEALPELCRAQLPESELLFEATLQVKAWVADKPDERARIQDALAGLWLRVADQQPLALLIDDVELVDDASGGLLVALTERAPRHGLLVACASADKPGERSLDMLRQRCERASLQPLTAAETELLLRSMFGDAEHVKLLADRIFRVAYGNPAASIALLRHLLQRRFLTYDGGGWLLPTRVDAIELPATLDEALLARIDALSAPARQLAEWHALSTYGVLSLADQAWLCEWAGAGSAGPAQAELLEHELLTHEGQIFSLKNEAWASALRLALTPERARERQHALAELGLATRKPLLRCVHHLFEAGLDDRALDLLSTITSTDNERSEVVRQDLSLLELGRLFMRALAAADARDRSARQRVDLRRYVTSLASVCEDVPFERVAPSYLAVLRRDSGLDDWEALHEVSDPGARLMQALQRAAQRYAATPEHDRAYPVDQAIKHLMGYTVTCISISSSRYDARLCRSLPALITPFAALSPLIECMLNNCLAAREIVDGRYTQGRERWRKVLERLGDVKGDALRYVDMIRYSIAFALGCLEAAGGLESAEHWARQMEQLPLPLVDAHYLRRVVCLQQGDFEGAERFRRLAETLALKTGARPLYASVHALEVTIYTQARDLAALTQVVDRIRSLADRFPGWLAYFHCAHGCQELLRGDLVAAKRALEAALELCSPAAAYDEARSVSAFILSASVYMEVLLELGEPAEARAFGERACAECAAREMLTTDSLERALAVAESRLGEHTRAGARLDALLERQRAAGVSGLTLGASYEARARVAIAASDLTLFEEYAQLTAATYRYAEGSPLGARYLRLVHEAQRAGLQPSIGATTYETDVLGVTTLVPSSVEGEVVSALRDAATTEERAQRALGLICETAGARAGQLYLVERDGALRWVAAQLAAPGGELELTHARACLERAQSDDSQTTRLLSDDEPRSLGADTWTGAGGVMQQAFLLTSPLQTAARHAAVVVLDAPGSQRARKLQGTLRAVARHMLQADPAIGVTAND